MSFDFFRIADNAFASYNRFAKRSLSSFLEVETRDTGSEHALVTHDGALVSVLRVKGSHDVVGTREVEIIVDRLSEGLAPALRSAGHKLQFFFYRDPTQSGKIIAQALQGSEVAIRQQKLDLNILLDERRGHMRKWIAGEDFLIAIWTMTSALNKVEGKALFADMKAKEKEAPPATDGQWPWRTVDALRARHNSVVGSTQSLLKSCGVMAELLPHHEALVAMFESVNRSRPGWRPYLPGDRIRSIARNRMLGEEDVSFLFSPPLSRQMFTDDAERVDRRTVTIGDMAWSCCDMTLGPDNVKPFAYLLADMIYADPQMPWRASFTLEGDGLRGFGLKRSISSVLTWLGPFGGMVNRQIRDAVKSVQDYIESGGTSVRFRASFATWAPSGQLGALRQRSETLEQTITQWGNCQVDSMVGDPLEGVLSSAFAITGESTAPRASVPIEDALTMMPFGRVASPWTDGGLLLRTRDGKLFPYQPGSRLQTTWIDLIFSPPGGGKSVFLNSLNLATVLSAQNDADAHLPLISILDVGESSRGLIEMLQAALPPHRRQEAVYVKLTNNGEFSINPFDTQLGLRTPLPHERAFLVNLVTLMATPPGQQKPYDAMIDLVSRIIDIAYESHGDGESGRPRRYAPTVDPRVDEVLGRLDILAQLPANPTWWEVVDALFDANHPAEAAMAQRHAVPTLLSLIDASQDQRVQDEFSKLDRPVSVTSTGERLVDAFNRMMRTAQVNLQLISQPTTFDLAGSRVVSLDLNDVTIGGSPAADQIASLMYLVGRHAVARDFFLDPRDMPGLFPPRYRAWQMARMTELRRTPRRLVYDELHRATKSGGALIERQLVDDGRVGRKALLQIAMVSQLLKDFPEDLREIATGFWVMMAGEDNSVEEIAKAFGLSATQKAILPKLTGPTAEGAPMLAILKTKLGPFRQHLISTLGPIEAWAFSSTGEDREIRSQLFSTIGVTAALSILAERYPSGTVTADLEARKRALTASGAFNDTDMAQDMIGGIIAELTKAATQGTRRRSGPS